MVLMDMQLDTAGMVLTHWGPTGCNAAQATVYGQAAKPEPVNQVFRLVTCGAMGELAQDGSEVEPLVSGCNPMLVSMDEPVDV